MEEYTAVCICGRRVVLRLGPQATTKQCPNCGASVHIPAASEEEEPLSEFKPTKDDLETRPDIPDEVALFFEEDNAVTPEPPTEPTESITPTPLAESPRKEPACARCGRSFRGEWDEIDTDSGVFCHVCANLAFEKPTKKETPPLVPMTEVTKAMKPSGWNIFDQKQVREEREARKDGHRQWEMIALTVVAAITLLTICFWPESTNTSPSTFTPPTELSGVAFLFVHALIALLYFAATATTIYLTLQQTERLDPGGLRTNLPSVLWGALLMSIVWGVCSMVPIPLLPVIIAIVASIGILDKLFGFWGMDFVYYVVIGSIVNLLFWGIGALLFGMIGVTLS